MNKQQTMRNEIFGEEIGNVLNILIGLDAVASDDYAKILSGVSFHDFKYTHTVGTYPTLDDQYFIVSYDK